MLSSNCSCQISLKIRFVENILLKFFVSTYFTNLCEPIEITGNIIFMQNLLKTFLYKSRFFSIFGKQVITVVDIDGKKYRGEPYEEKRVVYPNPLLSSGSILR